jgi:phage virion morphogenesis protein
MDNDLSRLDEWFGRILAGLSPAERRKAATKLGRELRKANAARIAANIDPEGTPFARRQPRKDRRGRLRAKQPGKMFKGLRKLKQWKIIPGEDGVEITPATPAADRVASVSQFGETAIVGYKHGKGGSRTPIRYKYPERRLLGMSPPDERLTLDIAAELFDKPAR